MSRIAARLLGISPEETSFERRGFRGADGAVRARLERIGRTFLEGYHAGLEDARPAALVPRLDGLESDYRGFAFEGAGMSLALLDALTPWRRDRLRAFLEDAGGDHVYMVHVGAGWAVARLPWRMRSILGRLDPFLVWLAFDGWGFHQGYFHWRRSIAGRREVPRPVRGYGRQAFDQGLGRSLWFVEGADVGRIPAAVAAFPEPRRADLWSGVGLAATYAGGVERQDLETLLAASGSFRPQLVQGAAFAAEARRRAGNPARHTALACEVFCGLSDAGAAQLTVETRPDGVRTEGDLPAYEVWRRRVQAHPAVACRAAAPAPH